MLKRVLFILITSAIVLPIAICLVYASGALLGGLGDTAGKMVLTRVAQAGGLLWVLTLICLVLVTALGMAGNPDEPDDKP